MYELQILSQMIEQIDRHSLFYEKISGYKFHAPIYIFFQFCFSFVFENIC